MKVKESKLLSPSCHLLEDIVLPQANGLTVQDELHQANFSEPKFWGGSKNTIFNIKRYDQQNREKKTRMEYVFSTIRRELFVDEERSTFYFEFETPEKRWDFQEFAEDEERRPTKIKSTRTEKGGRLFWDLYFHEEGEEGIIIHRLCKISWAEGLDEKKAKSACETLMLAFDEALEISSPYLSEDFFKQISLQGSPKWLKNTFEPFWSEFTKPTSSDCSGSHSEGPTPKLSE
eukprot:GHVP01039768.1.p1 GENE.GHVP01039768.1~~GHVP01039768.1.p1  ORF type:complete len:232 (+),score=39.65 GHVP01039768.1:445-1140(+)